MKVFASSRRRLLLASSLLGVLVLLALAAGLGGCGGAATPAASASSDGGDAVVARVDGAPILSHEVAETIATSRITGAALTRPQAIDAMIKRRLVEADARKLGVVVSGAQVQARFDHVAQSVGGQQTLSEDLGQVGLTVTAYRAQLAGALLAESVADVRFAGITASMSQARSYYRAHLGEFTVPATVDVADIVVKTEPMAQAVKRRLSQGYSFAVTAGQYSDDPESKQNGGKLGWVEVDSLPADLAGALRSTAVGHVTLPEQAIGGWHILKLYGRRAQRVYPFSKVRVAVLAELTREARGDALARQLTQERAHAHVVIVS